MTKQLTIAMIDVIGATLIGLAQVCSCSAVEASKTPVQPLTLSIVCPLDAPAKVKLAAQEIRRYVYLRTGNESECYCR